MRVYRIAIKQDNDRPSETIDVVPNFVETEETEFMVGTSRVGIRLDTVLMGHESWVYGVAFHSTSHTRGLTKNKNSNNLVTNFSGNIFAAVFTLGSCIVC